MSSEAYTPNSRREFLKFITLSTVTAQLASGAIFTTGCAHGSQKPSKPSLFPSLEPQTTPDLLTIAGLTAPVFIGWDQVINPAQQKFGSYCDFIGFVPKKNRTGELTDEYYMWINHETLDPRLIHNLEKDEVVKNRTKKFIDREMLEVGGTVIKVKKTKEGWQWSPKDSSNFRVDAKTRIPFSEPVEGRTVTTGTLANCAGGVTPWGTFLSCEENFFDFYHDPKFADEGAKTSKFRWEEVYNHNPHDYGWVVETNPVTKKSVKQVALGRFAHECATVTTAKDGRAVVYLSDDETDQCFYKFISDQPNDLTRGQLFVANLEKGQWISLDLKQNPKLKEKYKTQQEIQIHTREAAKFAGGSLLDRPEDCEIHPFTKEIFINCTSGEKHGRPFGLILKLKEKDSDFLATEFTVSTFKQGGEEFAYPDNMVFDPNGNLWMTTDMPLNRLMDLPPEKNKFAKFHNNSLMYFPLAAGVNGAYTGECYRVAIAPNGAEFTGPCFSPDFKTLFMSVQHPGEGAKKISEPTTRWPHSQNSKKNPQSSVVGFSGPILDQMVGYKG